MEFGIPESWFDWFDRALIAAFDGDIEQARALLARANELDEVGRVGPVRGEMLLPPAVVADRRGRAHDCAVLLAIIRADPVPMSGGHSVAIYRHLRRRTGAALTEDQLLAARSVAEMTSTDDALTAFLSSSEGAQRTRDRAV